ncbi:unnamed protein product [uncultured bacterium]|nr:unnamed protein product [uncultured bacterium]
MTPLDPDQLEAVRAAALDLPPAQRAVLEARLNGETLSGIADRLHTSRQQVTSVQKKALSRLMVGAELITAVAGHIRAASAARPNNGGEHRPVQGLAYRHPSEECRVRARDPDPPAAETPRDDPGREARLLRHACEAAVRDYKKAWTNLTGGSNDPARIH